MDNSEDSGDVAFTIAKDEALRQQRAVVQHNIVDRKLRGGVGGRVLAAAAEHLLEEPLVWSCSLVGFPIEEGETEPVLLRPLYAEVYPLRALRPCQRVVLDSFLSSDEIAYYVNENLSDIYGDPIFDEEDIGSRKSLAARQDWPEDPLHDRICDRVYEQICCFFGEQRTLSLGGALLIRMQPEQTDPTNDQESHTVESDFHSATCHGLDKVDEAAWEYDLTTCHVDKANVGYYDYSVVLYLSTQGADFSGGQFVFNDPAGDEVVEARRGRCIMFTSGPHHLHQVRPVTDGSRMAIAMWFTLAGPREDGYSWSRAAA